MHCRTCGKKLVEQATVCVGCGCPPLVGDKFCQSCGAETNPSAIACVKCGVALKAGAGSDPKLLGEIKAQAITSLVVGILSIPFFCVGIILAPFAIYRGAKAKRLIDESGVGQEYRGLAVAGFIIGIVVLVLNIVFILPWLVMAAAQQGRGF